MSVEKKYYTTKELAEACALKPRWVVEKRGKIVGAQKVGHFWRFDKALVDARIARGKGILIET